MPKLVRSAYLKSCARCAGKHAHIVLPDGSYSEEFVDKIRGQQIVTYLLDKPLITEEEALALEEQISESELRESDDVDIVNLLIDLHRAHATETVGQSFLALLGGLTPLDEDDESSSEFFEDDEPHSIH